MRQKQLRVILTFPAAVDAMAMESYGAAHQVPGRLIPLPCWSAPPEARDAVEAAAQEAGLRTGGIYELML